MCGIAGYAGKGDKNSLEKMLEATSHRGPDSRGTFVDGNIGLGANRLSIIDLSPFGKQPMFDQDKSLSIVFNGEIYNFHDLRKQLVRKYRFQSKTDTEVVLYAYKEWGVDCLRKLNGMFSFVIYDRTKQLLFGARDRLGEKPLKYYVDRGNFAFASEVKGLLPIVSKIEIDPIAIHHYLTLQYVPAPFTGFQKIFKLPPAHYFLYKDGKLQIKRYWEFFFAEKLSLAEKEWEELLLAKLIESVKSRLMADVPFGVFLSGGIDSSCVVALMALFSKRPIKTFTISFDEASFNEAQYANIVARQYRTNHKVLQVTQKMMGDLFTHLADYYDEPFADNSAIPMLALSRLASKYVKVALSGDGGDENFGGYNRYNVVSFANLYNRIPYILRKMLEIGAKGADKLRHTKFSHRVLVYTRTFDQPFYRKYLYYSCFFDSKTKNQLYSSAFREAVSKSDTFNLFRSYYKPDLSDLDNALFIDISSYLPEDLLFKTDIASMAFSLEARSPFLNHELIELTAKMPSYLKIKFFKKKYIFKKLLANKHLLPKEIIQREKRGFVAPIDSWLKQEFKSFVLDNLESKKFKEANIFNQKKLEVYLQNYHQGREINSNNIFALLALASWIQKYF